MTRVMTRSGRKVPSYSRMDVGRIPGRMSGQAAGRTGVVFLRGVAFLYWLTRQGSNGE